MKNLFKIGLVIEFILCFSWVTLLWMTGCFFILFALPAFFGDTKDIIVGVVFLLWLIAGGVGITGTIKLLIHLLQPNSQQPGRRVYMAILIGIIANFILNIMFSNMWHDGWTQVTPGTLLMLLILNAPIICALHFLWLGFRRFPNPSGASWIRRCVLKPQQT